MKRKTKGLAHRKGKEKGETKSNSSFINEDGFFRTCVLLEPFLFCSFSFLAPNEADSQEREGISRPLPHTASGKQKTKKSISIPNQKERGITERR